MTELKNRITGEGTERPEELLANPFNYRRHPAEQLAALEGVLEEIGWIQRTIVNQRTGHLIDGHARVELAIRREEDAIPVLYVDLSENEERVALAALDPITGLAYHDDQALVQLLDGLEAENEALAKFLEELNPGDGSDPDAGGLTNEDDVPETPEQPVTVEGDVWILGNHRLMCGDSTNSEHVGALMNGSKATLLHADPPYGMGKEADGVENDNLYAAKLDAFQMRWWAEFRPFIEDNASAYIWGNAPDLWRLWYVGGLADSERMTPRNQIVWNKKHGQGIGSDQHRMFPTATEHCIFFMLGEQGFNNNADNYWEGWDTVVDYLRAEKKKTGWDIAKFKRLAGHSETSGCHWFDKSQWSFPTKEVYQSWQQEAKGAAFNREYDELKQEHDELKQAFYATRAYFDNTHDNMTDVWEFARVTGEDRHDHATPKPVEMMERVMRSSLPDGGLCVEPFGGSGSTLIGAEKTGRHCFTMELQPKYCDVIIKRWQDYTGKTAIHEAAGQPFDATQAEIDNGPQ